MLQVYTVLDTDNEGPKFNVEVNAQKFYRILQPLEFMGRAERALPFLDWGLHSQDRDRPYAEHYASLHWLHMFSGNAMQQAIEQFAMAQSYWLPQEEREWDVPPSIIMDADDDLFNVMPFHFGTYRWAGVRHIDGTPLNPGGFVAIKDTETGETKMLFEDGKNGFDIARNRNTVNQYRMNLGLAAAVTVSTPRLARAVLKESPNANVIVMPNCIDFDNYPEVDLAARETVRILWQGGHGHELCLGEVRQQIKNIQTKYPQAEFVFFGGVPEDFKQFLNPDQTKFIPWVSHRQYHLRLNSIGHDINIAPLYEHTFNESRSAIKFYESAACWKPAATLAKDFGPFQDEVIEGETGSLFKTPEEFESKLSALIEDATYRKTLAKNAKDWVRTERDPLVWAHKTADSFEGLRAAKKSVWKAPPEPIEVVNESVAPNESELRAG